MQRILLAIGGAAAFCAATTLLLQVAITRGLPVAELLLVTASATLLLAVASVFFAYRAFNRADAVTLEMERLSRSMDAAIKDVSARGDRDTAMFNEFSASLSSRIEALSARIAPNEPGTPAAEAEAEAHGTDADHPARRGKHAHPEKPAAPDALDAAGVEVALRRAVNAGQADLSLQPIVAAGRGAAGGFEVHFHIVPEEGQPVDVRRLQRPLPGVDLAAFERLAVVSATEAARRKLGDINENVPLHVAISSALLQDGLEFAAVLDLFRLHPGLAKSLVISLPADLAESGQHRAALEILSGLDIRFAAEDWAGSQGSLDKIKQAGVSFVKLAGDRLLDRAKVRKGAPSGAMLLEMATAAGIDVIATDVHSDQDAVSLIDIGIDLMTGERLAPPRRLKDDGGGAIKGQ